MRLHFRREIEGCKKRITQLQGCANLHFQNELVWVKDRLAPLLVQEDSFWKQRAK